MNNQNPKQGTLGERPARGDALNSNVQNSNVQSSNRLRNARQNAPEIESGRAPGTQNRSNPNKDNRTTPMQHPSGNRSPGQPAGQRSAPGVGASRTGGYRPVQMSGSRQTNQSRRMSAPYRGEDYSQMSPEQAAAESRRRAEARMADQRRKLVEETRRRKEEKQRKRVIIGTVTVFAALALIITVTVIILRVAVMPKSQSGAPVDSTTPDPFAPSIETDADGNIVYPDMETVGEGETPADIPIEVPVNAVDDVTEAAPQPPAETTWENYTFNFKADISMYEEYMNPKGDEYLTLINSTHKLEPDYVPDDLVDIIDTRQDGRAVQQIRLYAAKSLEAFLIEARAQGYNDVTVTSGFRNYNYQSQLFNARLLQYSYLGDEKAYAAASKIVAVPGTSEHQSGLCCDMHNLPAADVSFGDTPAGKWMAANCHKFGFIIRYPEGKTDITGITYEPWHFRYIGRYHACKIYERGICLEEYWTSLGRS